MEGTGGTVNSPHISPPMLACEKGEVETNERLRCPLGLNNKFPTTQAMAKSRPAPVQGMG
jgi:hypothetical protein